MSSLRGSYICEKLNAEFTITEANDSNGQGKGSFKFEGISFSISIHYHFKNSSGPEASLNFVGQIDDPNHYAGGAGSLPNASNVQEMNIAGGFATTSDAKGFIGKFVRK